MLSRVVFYQIHQNEDDLGRGQGDSKTTGNAGEKIACARVQKCYPKFMKKYLHSDKLSH